ncbi:MAG: SRPBCC family protein [Desulfobacterales bacterium]|uniref:SRPBCC family protein n=1 Tax=Candidatus Desulfatibia profunda TaxID=2841695 RepID=A0A8J6NZR0_9BACT|nr:SRPBCC family protein [Candidatus Desulfatibia profunda]MBL7178865.1 SRPBCC family protein [Desulfobacterales bacterium]
MDRNLKAQRLLLVFFVCIFLFLPGCSTKPIVTSAEYSRYEGEINQHTRLIRTDRHRIFRILTSADTFKAICPQGTIVTYEAPLPYRTGTFVHTKIDHIFKLTWRSRVEEVICDHTIRLQFLDGFFAGGTELWKIEPEDAFTRVTHTIIVRPRGLFKKLAWSLKVRRKHDKMLEALLDNLKHLAETD